MDQEKRSVPGREPPPRTPTRMARSVALRPFFPCEPIEIPPTTAAMQTSGEAIWRIEVREGIRRGWGLALQHIADAAVNTAFHGACHEPAHPHTWLAASRCAATS